MGNDAAARTEQGEGFSPWEMAAGGEGDENLQGERVRGSKTLWVCFPKEGVYGELGRRRFRGRAGSKAVPKMSHREE